MLHVIMQTALVNTPISCQANGQTYPIWTVNFVSLPLTTMTQVVWDPAFQLQASHSSAYLLPTAGLVSSLVSPRHHPS